MPTIGDDLDRLQAQGGAQSLDMPAQQPDDGQVTWGDWGHYLGIGANEVGGGLMAGARYLNNLSGSQEGSEITGLLEHEFDSGAQAHQDALTPTGKRVLSPDTFREFLHHPISTAIAKSLEYTPATMAMILPAGAISGAVGLAAAGGTAGVLNAGSVLDGIYQHIDETPDEKLREDSPVYNGLRQLYDEDEARRRYDVQLQGLKPLINFVTGAALTAALGPAATLARGGVQAGSRLAAAGMGAAEGAAGLALQSGVADVTSQAALMQSGQQSEFDASELAKAVLEGGAMGGLQGGAVGAAVGPREAVTPKGNTKPAPKAKAVITNDIIAPDQAVAAAVNDATGGKLPESPAPVTRAPVADTPTAEPAADINAQLGQLGKGKDAVWLPPETVDHLEEIGGLDAALGRGVPIEDFDGQGGILIAANPDVAAQARSARLAGGDLQQIIGQLTGDGEGKPVGTDTVVQQVTPEGNVTREQLVTPDQAPAVQQEMSEPGKTAQVTTTQDALARREQQVLDEKQQADLAPNPDVPTPRAPRVLQAQDNEAARIRAEAELAQRAHQQELNAQEAAAKDKGRNRKGEAAQKKAAEMAANAHKIFDAVPALDVVPTSKPQLADLHDRLETILEAAQKLGVKIPAKVTGATPDHIVWLREVKDLASKFGTKKGPSQQHVTDFVLREKAARGGDFSVMRGERKAAGEQKAAQYQGDVEKKAAPVELAPVETEAAKPADQMVREVGEVPADFRAENQDLAPTVSKSARGARVDDKAEKAVVKTKEGDEVEVDRAKAASPVRKVELTPEERAKYEVPGKVGPKGAEVLAKMKAKAEKTKSAPKTNKERLTTPTGGMSRVRTFAEIAEDHKAATSKVTEPTEAQKEAGNYPKEHERVHGLDISIENKKGSTRSGVSPDGKPWSVKMPSDYGYIRRTEGADGDHVDVYLGPDRENPRVTVIDQVDPDTRKFDEHKVMMGFRSRDEALKTYDAGFSDGRGMERVGNVRSMSIDEFKDWLKNGDTTKPIAKAVHAYDEPGAITVTHGDTEARVRPLESTDVKVMFERIRKEKRAPKTGLHATLQTLMRSKLLKAVGDLPVHIVDHEELQRAAGTRNGLGVYDPTNNHILLSERVMQEGGDMLEHVFTHEAVHALTSRALFHNEGYAVMVRDVMGEALEARPDLATHYGFKNEHEFLAEAMSNGAFQQQLARIKISRDLARQLHMEDWRAATMWDAFVETVRRVMGLGRNAVSALEAAMASTERLAYVAGHLPEDANGYRAGQTAARMRRQVQPFDADTLRGNAEDTLTNTKSRLRSAADALSSNWMLVDRAAKLTSEFGQKLGDVMRAKARQVTEAHKILEKEGGIDVVKDWAEARREHGNEAVDEAADLAIAASDLNVNLGGADNSHLGKDATKGWQAKAKLAALQARYDALPEGLQSLLDKTVDFYRKQHDEIARGLIKNTLEAANKYDPALADRAFKGELTEADKEHLGEPVSNALEHPIFKKMAGWYVPFRRYGDHVVSGHYELEAPKSAIKIDDNTVQFSDKSYTAARRAARKFAESQDLRHIQTKNVYVDKNDPTKLLGAEDTDAIPAFRVSFQTQHTEFLPTEAEAQHAFERLQKDGLTKLQRGVRGNEATPHGSIMSGDIKTLIHSLEQQQRFKDMSKPEQDALRQALTESAIRLMGSTKVQTSFLQRRNVQGQSHDLGRITADYARSSAGYISRLRHQPEIDKAWKALEDYREGNKYSSLKPRMDELVNAANERFKQDAFYQPKTKLDKASRRLLQISRLDKLAGLSFHVINSLEPITTSLPVIGGRHGFGSATRAMLNAYDMIGARRGIVAGLKDTVSAFNHDAGFTDYVDQFKREIQNSPMMGPEKKARLQAVLDYNRDLGLFADEAVFEVSRYADPTSNQLLRGLDRADLVANQLGRAVESINRAVTALASYDLEYKRTGNHEAALQRSHETTRDTMGDYSNWVSPPVFNHPLGRLALQFRKFALKLYYLLGKTLRGTLERDPEAAKQFLGLMVTHMTVAGALGLPLEPFKVALTAANMFGLTGYDWDDVEHAVRAQAAAILGVKGGEAFSHGLTRLIGVDLSSRMGLDSLATFGRPRSNKPQDIKSFLFDTLAGAPAGYLLDQIRAGQALMNGDVAKAAELTIPIKAATDLIRAGEGLYSQTNKSGHETMRAFNPFEFAAQAAGFTPAVKAENYEKKSYAAQVMQRDKDARAALQHAWIAAKPNEKAQVWAKVQAFNRGRPPAEQITMSQLNSAVRRYKSDADKYEGGLRFTKQNQRLRQSLSIYSD